MFFWTAEPMTAQGPRKGESSSCSMRKGFRTQPARLVRGSSRRIMSMRFRPANIRVINRRVCSSAVIGPAVPNKTCSRPTSRNVFPLRRPSTGPAMPERRAVVKGSLRRAKKRRALDYGAPFWPDRYRDGRLRREHFTGCCTRRKQSEHRQARQGLTGSLHIRTIASRRTAIASACSPCCAICRSRGYPATRSGRPALKGVLLQCSQLAQKMCAA